MIGMWILAGFAVAFIITAPFIVLCPRFRRWANGEKSEKTKPKKSSEKGLATGTIRIVEKMHEDGSEFYEAKQWRGGFKNSYVYWRDFMFDSKLREFDTVEHAQQAVNDEIDRRKAENERLAEKQRRKDYCKNMGEFKP